jgi:hypothetical protein
MCGVECFKMHTHIYVTLAACDKSKRCVSGGDAKYHDVCKTNIAVFWSVVLSSLIVVVVATTETGRNLA